MNRTLIYGKDTDFRPSIIAENLKSFKENSSTNKKPKSDISRDLEKTFRIRDVGFNKTSCFGVTLDIPGSSLR